MGLDYLVAFGPLSQGILSQAMRGSLPPKKALGILNHSEVIPQLESLIKPGDILLIKGSHGMRLENVVRALEEQE